jgi:hypothetical protein
MTAEWDAEEYLQKAMRAFRDKEFIYEGDKLSACEKLLDLVDGSITNIFKGVTEHILKLIQYSDTIHQKMIPMALPSPQYQTPFPILTLEEDRFTPWSDMKHFYFIWKTII